MRKMQMMQAISKAKALRRQAGFTLIELTVIVIILGILAAYLGPKFTNQATLKSRANAVISFADNGQAVIKTVFSYIQPEIAAAGSANNTNVLVANRTWMDALYFGCAVNQDCDVAAPTTPIVRTALYAGKYKQSGAGKLDKAMKVIAPPGAAAGTYTVQGYPATITAAPAAGGAATSARHFSFNFTGVPEDVALVIAQELENENLQALTAAADTTGQFRYTVATNGQRTISIEQEMN